MSGEVLLTEEDKHHTCLQAGQGEDLGIYRMVFLISVHGKVIGKNKKSTVHKLEKAVHPLTGMAVIHRNLDRMEKSTKKKKPETPKTNHHEIKGRQSKD